MRKSNKQQHKQIIQQQKALDRKEKQKYKKNKKFCLSNQDEKIFQERLEKDFGLTINYMDGDGNCLFRALSDQIEDNQHNHGHYRHKIMQFIEKNADHFREFMEDDESFDKYIVRMNRSGEWGGNQELVAASQFLKADIVVHQHGEIGSESDPPNYIIRWQEDENFNSNEIEDSIGSQDDMFSGRKVLHVSYHGECHYNSVKPLVKNLPPIAAIDRPKPSATSSTNDTNRLKEVKQGRNNITSVDQSNLQLLSRTFPTASEDDILTVYSNCRGGLDEAIESLYEITNCSPTADSLNDGIQRMTISEVQQTLPLTSDDAEESTTTTELVAKQCPSNEKKDSVKSIVNKRFSKTKKNSGKSRDVDDLPSVASGSNDVKAISKKDLRMLKKKSAVSSSPASNATEATKSHNSSFNDPFSFGKVTGIFI